MAPGLAAAPPPVRQPAPAAAPAKLSPAAALAAARVEQQAGRTAKARALLLGALPRAGELRPLFELELAKLSLEGGRDPWPHLEPLLRPAAPAALRGRAQELALRAVEKLPLPQARAWLKRRLPKPLRRSVAATVALREANPRKALSLLEENSEDRAAGQLALALSETPLAAQEKALLARALFANGFWQQAAKLLAELPPGGNEEFATRFLRARVAYRLGRWEEAIEAFALAEQAARTKEDRLACWLFAARAYEQLGREDCALEKYAAMAALAPEAPEAWVGAGMLLARRGQGEEVLALYRKAPEAVRRELQVRFCALLAMVDRQAASALARQAVGDEPGVALCQAFLAKLEGEHGREAELLSRVLADPRAGKVPELACFLLPLGEAAGTEAARDLRVLAALAVHRGIAAARQALARGLAQDPSFAPLLEGHRPPPPLPPALASLLAAGLAQDAAHAMPHLFPRATPGALAWSAAFFAREGNWREALAAGEQLRRLVGEVPACLLPDQLLPHLVPPDFAALFPRPGPWRPLLFALARQESRFDAGAFSPVGARGVFQLMPETLRRLGAGLPVSPQEEAALALAHLEDSARSLGGDPLLLAAAYNAGSDWVGLWLAAGGGPHPLFPLAIPYRETRGYALAVAEGLWLARHLE